MTILVAPKRWQKTRALATERTSAELTAEESANVKAALRFLRTRHGGEKKLAALLRVSPQMVAKNCGAKRRPRAMLAIRVARLAGVSVEDVLGGAWPPDGACPNCGRCT
jgi:hypothetical protein